MVEVPNSPNIPAKRSMNAAVVLEIARILSDTGFAAKCVRLAVRMR